MESKVVAGEREMRQWPYLKTQCQRISQNFKNHPYANARLNQVEKMVNLHLGNQSEIMACK